MSLSISSLINYRTKLEGMKGKKEKQKIRSSSGHIARLSELPCCSNWLCVHRREEVRHGRGHLGHGDLHGLQHFLHRLHGAFVLLGSTAGQLHVRVGKVKGREAARGPEKVRGREGRGNEIFSSSGLSTNFAKGEPNTLQHSSFRS